MPIKQLNDAINIPTEELDDWGLFDEPAPTGRLLTGDELAV